MPKQGMEVWKPSILLMGGVRKFWTGKLTLPKGGKSVIITKNLLAVGTHTMNANKT